MYCFLMGFPFLTGTLQKKTVLVRSHRISGPFATSSGCSSAGRLDVSWQVKRLNWDLGSGGLDWDMVKYAKVFLNRVGQWRQKPFTDEGSFHSSLPW